MASSNPRGQNPAKPNKPATPGKPGATPAKPGTGKPGVKK